MNYTLCDRLTLTDEFYPEDTCCYRAEMSDRWLRGQGIEIGALHRPLPLSSRCSVRYVDYKTLPENRACYPELAQFEIVNTDIVDDGFVLSSIPDRSQDFVIANHALEHSPDPYGTLLTWARKLRSQGMLYITLPIAEKCFDRGRELTSLEHLLSDHIAFLQGNKASILTTTRTHLAEFLQISGQNIRIENGLPPASAEEIQALSDYLIGQLQVALSSATDYASLVTSHITVLNKVYDIHYHTFSPSSLEGLLRHFANQESCCLEQICKSGSGECIAVLQRL